MEGVHVFLTVGVRHQGIIKSKLLQVCKYVSLDNIISVVYHKDYDNNDNDHDNDNNNNNKNHKSL